MFGVEDRLDSWKEIASYIKRDVSTCRNWKRRLGLPIYQIDKKSIRSRVFAYKSEIDRWFEEKAGK